LGLAKGALLCIVITFFTVTLAPAYRDQIVGSKSGRLVAELIVRADQFLPPDVVETVRPFVQRFEDELRRPAAAAAAPPRGGPSPFEAMWDGVRSAAAWTGAEQGGAAQQAGGQPAAWQPLPPGHPAAPAQPQPPAGRGWGPPAAGQPPAEFPIGAQTPLPIR